VGHKWQSTMDLNRESGIFAYLFLFVIIVCLRHLCCQHELGGSRGWFQRRTLNFYGFLCRDVPEITQMSTKVDVGIFRFEKE
jgi:hypothetical protein